MKFENLAKVLSKEGNLVEPNVTGDLIFVGDTHGDLQASRKVIEKYLNNDNVIVFLGDYVDRGPKSRENLHYLLTNKLNYPQNLYLLQGNHEGYKYAKFSPVDFWDSLPREKLRNYQDILGQLPLVFSWEKIVATHGGLPNLDSIDQIEEVEGGDENWRKITWGDFTEQRGLGAFGLGRPQLGKDYFLHAMSNLDKQIHIRSHQPNAPLYMFDKRCLTVFTSSAYGTDRRIVIARGEVNSGEDLIVSKI
ncbi:MAG: metallophosphoesterase family protein [Candidatus Acetothermia bacterium]